SRASRRRMTETGIEETGVVNAELPDQRVEGRHFRRMGGRHVYRLAGNQDVKLVRVKHEVPGAEIVKRFPEIRHGIGRLPVDINEPRVMFGAIADESAGPAFEINGKRNAAAGDVRLLGRNERLTRMQRGKIVTRQLGIAAAET